MKAKHFDSLDQHMRQADTYTPQADFLGGNKLNPFFLSFVAKFKHFYPQLFFQENGRT